MGVHASDGSEVELVPGDAYVIEPGHDAWVIGDEAFVAFEFDVFSAEHFAEP
jgi:quercetin dioxygenase-like cupin family protein